MCCIDRTPEARRLRPALPATLAAALLAAACTSPPPERAKPPPVVVPAPGAAARPLPPAPPPARGLPAPEAPRSTAQLREQAARRIAEANPALLYAGPVPEVLLAIPVLEVELNADGSIRRIEVLRQPRQALDTVPLAIDAVRRAAPFGNVSRLPRPWKFTETFLFNDERRFKLRSLER